MPPAPARTSSLERRKGGGDRARDRRVSGSRLADQDNSARPDKNAAVGLDSSGGANGGLGHDVLEMNRNYTNNQR